MAGDLAELEMHYGGKLDEVQDNLCVALFNARQFTVDHPENPRLQNILKMMERVKALNLQVALRTG